MKSQKPVNRIRKDGNGAAVAKQGKTVSGKVPGEKREWGHIKWFNPAMVCGFIAPERASVKRLKLPPKTQVIFGEKDLTGFDPYRIMAGDRVSFAVKRDGKKWRAESVRVEFSIAEECERSRKRTPDMMVRLCNLGGAPLGGFTLRSKQAEQVEQVAAVKEQSPAQFIQEAITAQVEKHLVRPASSGAEAGSPLTLFLRMESPVREAMALLTLFGRKLAVLKEGQSKPIPEASGIGCQQLAERYAQELHNLWNVAVADVKAMREGTARPAVKAGENPTVFPLGFAVEKVRAFLVMTAEEIEIIENETAESVAQLRGEPAPKHESGFYQMATECGDALDAAFGAAFAEWSQLDKAAGQRAAA